MLSLVARRAFFCGRRKLRAKPGFTFTTSPIWPSFGTRSSRMTFIGMVRSFLGDHVGEERQEAGALDRLGEFALLLGRDRGDAARHDLAALRDEALQEPHVLVVDLRRIGAGERAALAATGKGTTLGAHSSSPPGTTTGASSPKRGRSRRGGRSLQPPRSPRSPPGRSDFSVARSMTARAPLRGCPRGR